MIIARSTTTVHTTDAKNDKQILVTTNSNLSPYNVRLFTTVPTPEPALISSLPSAIPSVSPQIPSFNSFASGNGATGTCPPSNNNTSNRLDNRSKRFSLDNNAVPLQFQRSATQFSTDYNDKNNETATNINNHSKTSAKNNSNSNTDQEKEFRRQRRLRRRSLCQETFPVNEVDKPEILMEQQEQLRKVLVKKHLFNNGVEVTSSSDERNQVMEDAKWHILSLRRKRYQFLGLTPSPPRTAMQS
ncbi:hypothetical protein WUBG_12100 [Wuchereria bancrofti]|uniref:Uncharacterized protein n=1 Tax=Wuchereria bancrofti TaxID=6293 RepID=J9E4A8_WUCBA|nr:hypothetical protein WUBG_12100 [Wuchereria bancrofti]